MKKDLIFVGGGGHYKDLLYLCEYDKYTNWNNIGFLDDNENLKDRIGPINKLPWLLKRYKQLHYCIAINSSTIRRDIDLSYGNINRSANLIHETAVIGTDCVYQNGITMGPYSILTTQVGVGTHTHINSSVSINQNSKIGNYCTLSPGARVCGDVKMEDAVSVGAGAVIINLIEVGSNSILGAGTVVVKDIPKNSTVVGVPGKIIKTYI